MEKKREIIYKKFNGRCAYCGRKIAYNKMEIDHIIPKSRFQELTKNKRHYLPYFLQHLTEKDVNHIDNLYPCCSYCNDIKEDKTIFEFRNAIKHQISLLNRYVANYKIAKTFRLIVELDNDVKFYFEKQKKHTKD